MVISFSFDDLESGENDFLNLLGIEQNSLDLSSDGEPESPRECQRLLRQFEEVQASDELIFDFDDTLKHVEFFASVSPVIFKAGDCSDHFDFSLAFQAVKKGNGRVSHLLGSRGEAKMLENVEGLNAKAFKDCPHISPGGFGSPVYISPEKPPKLPALREGLGQSDCSGIEWRLFAAPELLISQRC